MGTDLFRHRFSCRYTFSAILCSATPSSPLLIYSWRNDLVQYQHVVEVLKLWCMLSGIQVVAVILPVVVK